MTFAITTGLIVFGATLIASVAGYVVADRLATRRIREIESDRDALLTEVETRRAVRQLNLN